MATAHAKTDNLDKLATDFKAAATTLEGFTTTLHKDVAALKWEGGAADKFKSAIKADEAMLTHAITMMHTLSSRISRLSEDAKAGLKKLEADEANLVATVKQNVKVIEQAAQLDHETVQQYLADPDNQAASQLLTNEKNQYDALSGEIKSLGGN